MGCQVNVLKMYLFWTEASLWTDIYCTEALKKDSKHSKYVS